MRKQLLLLLPLLLLQSVFLCPNVKSQQVSDQINIVGINNVVISDFRFNISCDTGVYAENCNNLTIANCTFEDSCSFGIYLYNVSNVIIFNNIIDAYYEPMLIHTCTNVIVTYNTLKDGSEQFQIYNSRNIVFHHNNIFNDEYSTHPTNDYPRVSNTTCTWDDGDGEGNYWSDYAERYPNATNNGLVWNTPYQIDPDDVDGREHYDIHPLVNDPTLPTRPKLRIFKPRLCILVKFGIIEWW